MDAPVTVTAAQPYDDPDAFRAALTEAQQAAAAYYDTAVVVMTDADYDHLADRISATLQRHPDWDDRGVTTAVAAGTSLGGTIDHPTAMLSLDKATDTEPAANAISANATLDQFLDVAGRTGYTVEVKLDGNAIRAVYQDGDLLIAVTRGDGRTGEDVTPNVLRTPGIAGLPARLDHRWTGEVRGEVFMSDADFETASNNRIAAGGKPFANPRNATSGSLRALDRTYDAPMTFGAYSITGDRVETLTSHTDRMSFAADLGFGTAAALTPHRSDTVRAATAADAKFAIIDIKIARDTLGFPIDGAVITYDGDSDRDRVGDGNRAPRWALAWKYPPREATSTLRGVDVAVGRTGRMSLTARIDPVLLDGSTVARASGHNAPWLTATGMGIGHRVMVVKRGDIIPYISLLDGPQPDNIIPWQAPATCPQCDQPWDTTSLLWRCHTPDCSIVGRIAYAAGRDQLDIDGLGEEVATALVEAGLVTNLADLFDLTTDQIAATRIGTTTTGAARLIGKATAARIAAGIANAKTQPLNRTIGSLGIRHTGRTLSRGLARHFTTLAALRSATIDDLAEVEGIGQEKARHIHHGLAAMSNVLDRLVAAGITTALADDGEAKPLAGKTYVVSGSVPGYTRTTIAERIEQLGGKASSSVSPNTTALVTSETSTAKAKKAASLDIPVIDPDEFARLIA